MHLLKKGNQIMPASPSVLSSFIVASRPKTWIAGVSPVLIGTAIAASKGSLAPLLFTCSLFFSLFIQIGTNYANDYFDFINGADNKDRVGPLRAVANGWIHPKMMRQGAYFLYFAAFCVSIPLIAASGLWALFFVLSSIAFGILYTGGPKPLGYIGLGELLVLLYFGPIAVSGSYFVQTHQIDSCIFALSFSPGLLSCAILAANNLRDIETDRLADKKTLVVRFGKKFGAWEYAIFVSTALLLPIGFGFFSSILLFPLAIPLMRKAFAFQTADEIVPLLPRTALLLILFTLFFCAECMF